MTEYKSFINDSNKKSIRLFQISIEELMEKQDLSTDEMKFLNYHKELLPVGNRPCTVNQICWLFEKEFHNILPKQKSATAFDYTILKSGASYNKNDYKKIQKVKAEYDLEVKNYQCLAKTERLDKDEVSLNRTMLILKFKAACEAICPNEKELCDILLDLCYTTSKSKQFVWDVCGETVINNLLEKNHHTINYPVRTSSIGEFEFAGESFVMKQRVEKEVEEPLLF
jgi:hypothetical protein